MIHEVDASWQESLRRAWAALPKAYRDFLDADAGYFPNKSAMFNAFKTMRKRDVRYILFGQDPYPRIRSAIGYAFIDGAVEQIFVPKGLDTRINRATSLRNFVKMVLVADGRLSCADTSQDAIAAMDKTDLIDSMDALRANFEKSGVLLLNTALIFTAKEASAYHIRMWQGFIGRLVEQMQPESPKLILFGAHAKALKKLPALSACETIELEHPYNHTFICNPDAHRLFGDMELFKDF